MRPRKTILLCDGDERALGERKYLLELRAHCRVVTAPNGERALAMLQHLGLGVVHLLIASHELSGISGSTLIQRTKERDPEMPALLIGKNANWRLSLANGFLSQPNALELLEAVCILLTRKRGPKKPARAVKDAVATAESVIA